MRNSILVILAVLLTACGGEAFQSQFGEVGGSETGAADSAGGATGGEGVTVTPGGKSSGGSSTTGGGKGAGGSTATAGAPTTGGSSSCKFDEAQLTSALPSSIEWQGFTYTNSDLCVMCRDKPCVSLGIVSWGTPTVDDQGRYIYYPNTGKPMVPLNIGKNDGMCTKQSECGIKLNYVTLVVTVGPGPSGLSIADAQASAVFQDNMCVQSARFNPSGATPSLQQALVASVQDLKIPCAK